jgi:hypothetical protein
MEQTVVNMTDVAHSLGFDQRQGEVFFGWRRGYAIGLKVVNPLDHPLLLVHVRFPFGPDAPEVKAVTYGAEIKALIEARKVDVDFGERLAWVTFVDGADTLLDGSFSHLLDSILLSFSAAGLEQNASTCFYCQRNPVTQLGCHDDKVAVICPACLEERRSAPENRPAEATDGAMPVLGLAIMAAALGAVCWAGFWISFMLILESIDSSTVYIPRIVEAGLVFCVGGITGGPVGLAIQLIQRRGRHLSMAVSFVCSASAVLVGEVAFIAWLIYQAYHVVSLPLAWQILPQAELALGEFHLGAKVLGALLAIGIAMTMARPRKPTLKL